MSLKKKILIILASMGCIVFIVSGATLYYFFSNIEHYSGFLAQNIEAVIHRKVSIGSVSAQIWRGLGVEVRQFAIKDERGEQDIFTANHLTFGLKFFPLLIRQVVFHKVIVDSPRITIVRDETGAAPLLKDISSLFQKEQKPPGAFKQLLTPSLSINRAIIRQGAVEFIDRSVMPNPLIVRAEGVEMKWIQTKGWREGIVFNFTSRIVNSGHQSLVRIEGRMNELPQNGDFSRLVLDSQVELKDFPLPCFWPYYQRFLPFEKATAIVDLNINVRGNPFHAFHSSGSLKMKEAILAYPRVFASPLTPENVELSYRLDKDDDSLNFPAVDLRLDDCNFTGSFMLRGLKAKDLHLAAELKSNRFLWSRFRGYLPLKIMAPGLARFWMKSMEEGWVEVKSASCAGRIKDFAKINQAEYSNLIKGKAKVSGFNLTLLEGLIPLKDLQGSVVIGRGDLFMRDLTGTLRGSPLIRAEGTITRLYDKAALSLKADADLKMPQILPMLLHEQMPARMKPLLKDITALGGQAEMKLSISGIRLSGQYVPPVFDGSLSMNRVSIAHKKLPYPLTDLNGLIPFTDRLLTSRGITGKLGQSTFSLMGKMGEWQEINSFFDLTMTSDIKLPELKRFTPEGFFADIYPQGTGYLKGTFKGYLNKLSFSGDLDLTRGSYRLSEWLQKPKGVSNKLQCSGLYLYGKNDLQLDSLRYMLKSSEIRGRGKFIFNDSTSFSSSMKTKGFNLAELSYINVPDLRLTGIVSGEAAIKGEWGNWGKADVAGMVKCDRVGLRTKSSPKPIVTVSSSIRFDKKSLTLDSFVFATGESSFTAKGEMKGFSTPRIRLNITSPFLAFDDLIALREKIKWEEEKEEKGRREWLSAVSLEGDVSVAQGRYQNFTFSDLKTKALMKKGALTLAPFELVSGAGKVASELTFDLAWKEHTCIDSDITMENLDVKSVLNLLSLKDDTISGTFNIEGDLVSQFPEFKELTRSLNGTIKLEFSHGRIQKFTILSKILTILNLSQIFKLRFDEFITRGMPYKSIKGTLTVKDGVLSTEDLFLDGDQMRISGVGSINLPLDELNLSLAVEPLVTVDKILNNIPIIGKIFTGKDKSLIVSYFKVTGKIADPKVKVVPLKSLTRGVSNILEGLLGIPQQLLDVPQKILNPAK